MNQIISTIVCVQQRSVKMSSFLTRALSGSSKMREKVVCSSDEELEFFDTKCHPDDGSCSSSEDEEESTSDEETTSSEESSSEEEKPRKLIDKNQTRKTIISPKVIDPDIPHMVQINAEDSLEGSSVRSSSDRSLHAYEKSRYPSKQREDKLISRQLSVASTTSSSSANFKPGDDVKETESMGSARAHNESPASQQKKYSTASGLPPACQLRDAQFLKLNFPESNWAPDIRELEFLEANMSVQCTLVCSYDPSIRETFWVTLNKVMRKRRATGVSQICVGYVNKSLSCCDLPRGSVIVLLPKHIQKVDSKNSDLLFQKLMEAEQRKREQNKIRPHLPFSPVPTGN